MKKQEAYRPRRILSVAFPTQERVGAGGTCPGPGQGGGQIRGGTLSWPGGGDTLSLSWLGGGVGGYPILARGRGHPVLVLVGRWGRGIPCPGPGWGWDRVGYPVLVQARRWGRRYLVLVQVRVPLPPVD